MCRTCDSVRLVNPEGYIASEVTRATGCGNEVSEVTMATSCASEVSEVTMASHCGNEVRDAGGGSRDLSPSVETAPRPAAAGVHTAGRGGTGTLHGGEGRGVAQGNFSAHSHQADKI